MSDGDLHFVASNLEPAEQQEVRTVEVEIAKAGC